MKRILLYFATEGEGQISIYFCTFFKFEIRCWIRSFYHNKKSSIRLADAYISTNFNPLVNFNVFTNKIRNNGEGEAFVNYLDNEQDKKVCTYNETQITLSLFVVSCI